MAIGMPEILIGIFALSGLAMTWVLLSRVRR